MSTQGETKVFRLSELYIDYKMIEKLLDSVVVTPDGRELGTIYDIRFNDDRTPRKIAIKGKDATFYVNPKHMFLAGDKIILQEPTQLDLRRAAHETLKALQELLEALGQDPEKTAPNVAVAEEHLRNALKYLEGEDTEKRLEVKKE
jgi:sporulation protein YlmC with PRC-barrel domain